MNCSLLRTALVIGSTGTLLAADEVLNRMPEVEILPACEHHGLGVASYSPIARGVLTGKYAPGVIPHGRLRLRGREARKIRRELLRPQRHAEQRA